MKHKIHKHANIMEDYYDNEIMNHFMKQYQHLYLIADSWEEYSFEEIIVELENGKTYLYNWADRTVMLIKMFYDTGELTEEEWRLGFGYLLGKEIRNARMMKQELAEEISISNVMLSRYLSGMATPSGRLIHRISEILGCDVNDILPHDFVPLR